MAAPITLLTVRLWKFYKDTASSYVTLDHADYASHDAIWRAILEGRTLNDKYIRGLIPKAKQTLLYAAIVAGETYIDIDTLS